LEAAVTYDSSRFRGDAGYSDEPGFRDAFRDSATFREDPAFRESAALRDLPSPAEAPMHSPSYAPGNYPVGDYAPENTLNAGGVADDQDGDDDLVMMPPRPLRDRLAVHFGWELVLLLAVGALGFLLYRNAPKQLRGAELEGLYIYIAALGFVAVGMSLSLRAAVPNLALGPVAYAAALFFADNSDRGILTTAAVTGLLAVAVGVAIAVVVTALQMPAWAASLAAGLGLIVWIQEHPEAVGVVNGAYRPTEHPLYWFLGFVGISVLGGLLGLMPGVRRAVGRFRPVGDPAVRSGGAVAAALALIGSSLLAAVSGILLALHNREVSPTENGLGLTGLALGAALVGGTSVYGRRGGLLGTALAVIGLALIVEYVDSEGYVVTNLGLAAAAIGVGLLVSRLVEALGQGRFERRAGRHDAGGADAGGAASDWTPPPQADNGWNTAGGANWTPPAGRPGDAYEERWGSR